MLRILYLDPSLLQLLSVCSLPGWVMVLVHTSLMVVYNVLCVFIFLDLITSHWNLLVYCPRDVAIRFLFYEKDYTCLAYV